MSQMDLNISKQTYKYLPKQCDTFAQVERLDLDLDSPRLRKACFTLGIYPMELKFVPRDSSKLIAWNITSIDLNHIEHIKNNEKYKIYYQKLRIMQEEKHRLLINKVLKEYAKV